MSNEIKWADVAHHYLKSGIKGMAKLHGSVSDPIEMPIGVNDLQDFPPRSFVPILRHLKDITEAEAREIYRIMNGQAYEPCYDGQTCLDWLNVPDYLDGCMRSELSCFIGNPIIWLWLISKGFDLFDLIGSGQAIRKEATQ